VKFSAEDSVIAIGSRYDPAHREVRLWVRDEGVGISGQDQQRVFTRFTRLDRNVDGTGLGLSIVSLIAQAHGGRVELESEVGAGSTFTVVVPLAVVPLAVDMLETEVFSFSLPRKGSGSPPSSARVCVRRVTPPLRWPPVPRPWIWRAPGSSICWCWTSAYRTGTVSTCWPRSVAGA